VKDVTHSQPLPVTSTSTRTSSMMSMSGSQHKDNFGDTSEQNAHEKRRRKNITSASTSSKNTTTGRLPLQVQVDYRSTTSRLTRVDFTGRLQIDDKQFYYRAGRLYRKDYRSTTAGWLQRHDTIDFLWLLLIEVNAWDTLWCNMWWGTRSRENVHKLA